MKTITFTAEGHPEVIMPTEVMILEIHNTTPCVLSAANPSDSWTISQQEYKRIKQLIQDAEVEEQKRIERVMHDVIREYVNHKTITNPLEGLEIE